MGQRLTRERAYSPVLKYNEGLWKSQLLRCPCHFLSLFLRHVSCLLTYEFVYIVTYVYIVMYPMSGESNK